MKEHLLRPRSWLDGMIKRVVEKRDFEGAGQRQLTGETEYNLKMNLAQHSSKDERRSNILSSSIYD